MEKLTIAPFKVIGISVRTTNENGRGIKDIGGLWGKFMGENILAAIPNKVDDTIYAIYTDYEGDHTKPYTTILGCKVQHLDNIPNGMNGKEIEGGTYVNLPAKGDIMQGIVGSKWGEIWQMDLDRTYIADFEIYGEKTKDVNNAEVDILIGIK